MTSFSVKIFTIVIRTLAKPIVAWITHHKKFSIENQDSRINKFLKKCFFNLGQKSHFYNSKLNNTLFKLSKEMNIKPLNEQQAIEKGAEVFSEIIVYSILIILPTLEILRQLKAGKEKEIKKEKTIEKLNQNICEIDHENQELRKSLENLKTILNEINLKLDEKEKKNFQGQVKENNVLI